MGSLFLCRLKRDPEGPVGVLGEKVAHVAELRNIPGPPQYPYAGLSPQKYFHLAVTGLSPWNEVTDQKTILASLQALDLLLRPT